MSVSLIVLAAGQGTRMNSDLPKALHQVGAAPLLHHALRAGQALGPERVIVVAGHGAEAVTKAALAFDDTITVVEQRDRLGTGHAVAQALPALKDATGDALILYGDTPFIRAETLELMRAARSRYSVIVLGFEAADPGRYGRLITRAICWNGLSNSRTQVLWNAGLPCATPA